MPLIQVTRKLDRVSDLVVRRVVGSLPAHTAKVLTCPEGGLLKPEDIMLEVSDLGPLCLNNKDINIRVLAHDYHARRKNLAAILKDLSQKVVSQLPYGLSWYVWVILAETSYGSDTDDK